MNYYREKIQLHMIFIYLNKSDFLGFHYGGFYKKMENLVKVDVTECV